MLNLLSIPDISAADFDNPLNVDLVTAEDAIDEEIESNGTTIAEVPIHAKLKAIRLKLIVNGATSVSNQIRWALYKMPNGSALYTSLTDAFFNSSNDDATSRSIRKYTIAKGQFSVNPSTAMSTFFPRIRKAAISRIADFNEDDVLRLVVCKDTAGTTCQLSGYGVLYFKHNG